MEIILNKGPEINSNYDRADYMFFNKFTNSGPLMIISYKGYRYTGFIKGRNKIVYIGDNKNVELDESCYTLFSRLLVHNGDEKLYSFDEFIFYDRPYIEIYKGKEGTDLLIVDELVGVVFSKQEMIEFIEGESA